MHVVFLSQYFDRVLPPEQNSVGIVTYEIARRLAADANVTVLAVNGSMRKRRASVNGMVIEQIPLPATACMDHCCEDMAKSQTARRPDFLPNPFMPSITSYRRSDASDNSSPTSCASRTSRNMCLTSGGPRHKAPSCCTCIVEWLNQLDERTIASAIEASDLVLGCSEHVMEQARAKFKTRRFGVLPNGVPVEATRTPSGPRHSRVLFVGGFRRRKVYTRCSQLGQRSWPAAPMRDLR